MDIPLRIEPVPGRMPPEDGLPHRPGRVRAPRPRPRRRRAGRHPPGRHRGAPRRCQLRVRPAQAGRGRATRHRPDQHRGAPVGSAPGARVRGRRPAPAAAVPLPRQGPRGRSVPAPPRAGSLVPAGPRHRGGGEPVLPPRPGRGRDRRRCPRLRRGRCRSGRRTRSASTGGRSATTSPSRHGSGSIDRRPPWPCAWWATMSTRVGTRRRGRPRVRRPPRRRLPELRARVPRRRRGARPARAARRVVDVARGAGRRGATADGPPECHRPPGRILSMVPWIASQDGPAHHRGVRPLRHHPRGADRRPRRRVPRGPATRTRPTA